MLILGEFRQGGFDLVCEHSNWESENTWLIGEMGLEYWEEN